ncbi:MAG: NADH-quinone oxidoreductase subunit A [Candidatus Marsarchaeota archaeon]|nr:NADH-quinone oxidoreductase subunit A [Candidatus Marsarchaeota archaeon]MCL5106068.1 NADH-quinone oxidoreductase subunit A [Candidatus Marsarchaeota archaeon]
MISTYIILVVSFLFALSMPLSFLAVSKLLRPSKDRNPVKNAPYESAEQTVGKSMDTINEYMSFFSIFLAFEIIAIVMVLWAYSSSYFSYGASLLIILSLILSMVFSSIAYRLSSEVHG